MLVPTVHLNGTSKQELLNQNAIAIADIEAARESLQAAAPNGRDYYPQGPTALKQATAEHLDRVRRLDAIAKARGQSLAQMAVAWVLRDRRVTSALIGASRPEQVADCVKALDKREFTADELAAIDAHATDGGVNLWRQSAGA